MVITHSHSEKSRIAQIQKLPKFLQPIEIGHDIILYDFVYSPINRKRYYHGNYDILFVYFSIYYKRKFPEFCI